MRLAALLVVALLAGACQQVLPVGPVEAVGEASDEQFVFVVRSPRDRYAVGQPIDVFAELIYQGTKNRETVYHGGSPVLWRIVQLDGPAVMEGGMEQPCLSTDVRPGVVGRYPFHKAGVIGDTGPFDRAWFEQDALTLPAGRWRVLGALLIAVGDCGGERHDLEASIDLVVGP